MKTSIKLFVLLVSTSICSIDSYSQHIWQDTIVGFGIKPDIAIADGVKYIAYLSESNPGFVKCAVISENNISNETITTGYFYGPLDIRMDNNGQPRVVYHDHNTEDLGQAMRNEDGWEIDQIMDDGHDGWDGSLFIDKNNVSHIISIDPNNGVEYAIQNGDNWSTHSIDNRKTNYKFATSIQAKDNVVHVAYYIESLNELFYANNRSGEWVSEKVASDAIFPSLILNKNEEPVIAYLQRGLSSDFIAVSFKENGSWLVDKVEEIENVMVSFSGARKIVDLEYQNDEYHVAYSNLKKVNFASKNKNEWNIEEAYRVKSDEERLGQQTSLDFDKNGMPIIAFYSRSQEFEGGGAIHMLSATAKDTTQSLSPVIQFSINQSTNDPIPNVSIDARNADGETVQSFSDSESITLSDINENTTLLCPHKEDENTINLSAIDLVRMRKMVLIGTGPCKTDIIAADVNKSGNVSALDIIQTLNVILAKSDHFQDNESWRFYNSGVDIENSTLSEIYGQGCVNIVNIKQDQTFDFVGIKLGDILCNP